MARGPGSLTALLALPAGGYMLLAFAVPLAMLCAASFQGPSGFGFENYLRYLADPYYRSIVTNSLAIGLGTTLSTLAIAYPAAFAIAARPAWQQTAILAIVFVPLTVGTIVKSFGWAIALRRNGIVNNMLVGLGIVDAPVQMLFNVWSLAIGMTNIFLPFMLLPIYSVVRGIDARLYETAESLGAGALFRFTHVALPLTLPGILAGASLVFSLSTAAYVIPLLLGGDRFVTVPMLIANGFLNTNNRALGATMAVILLATTTLVLMLFNRAARRSRFAR